MFLHELRSSDRRFKTLQFRTGLNILVAERTEQSDQGDSRNGTGKSSFVRLLRYLFGGNLPTSFKSPALKEHAFTVAISMTGDRTEFATRYVTPTTRVTYRSSASAMPEEVTVESWRSDLAARAFGLDPELLRPTLGQLWGQLIRLEYSSPVKTHPTETDWESGTRLGYFFGLEPRVLSAGGYIARLEKQRAALKSAIREGAVVHLGLDEAAIRSELASARSQRDKSRARLEGFRVDDQYAIHQVRADGLSAEIRDLNDRALVLERRAREIREAVQSEEPRAAPASTEALIRLYEELGVHLPDAVVHRFDEVARFHESVVANRFRYLAEEFEEVQRELEENGVRRAMVDDERSGLLRLLRDAVALDTFLEAQRSLSELDGQVADLARRLESAESINEIDSRVKLETAAALTSVRNELLESGAILDGPISLFSELGAEIYRDHKSQLLVSVGAKAALKVEPKIEGDASDGIKGVATFLLDIVTVVTGIRAGRAPGLLVHDSHLFDAIDHRQVASCLNIGARLAEEFGFQYIVTMNSDFLASVESEAAFDSAPYLLPVTLKDDDESGGLFGFRFDADGAQADAENIEGESDIPVGSRREE